MTRSNAFPSDPHTCMYDWCSTEHGRTVHALDEDHRSVGCAVTVRVRNAAEDGEGRFEEWEVGLLRRSSDEETWFVVERPGDASIALSRDAARALRRAIDSDRNLRGFSATGDSGE
ncbi:hypothetical protein [Microbacterium hydrothermale]|uniref:hypothetical protein n=1 Tax=Microbacterium hydrothermale TaxID=857427 RepID=UPI0010A8F8A6|nr:hypothetical protein [Microbacterium hydrothermale]